MHVQVLIGPNFAESVNLSLLTQRFCTSFDGNEIDISGAQNGVIWSVDIFQVYWRNGHSWMSCSSIEKYLYNIEGYTLDPCNLR